MGIRGPHTSRNSHSYAGEGRAYAVRGDPPAALSEEEVANGEPYQSFTAPTPFEGDSCPVLAQVAEHLTRASRSSYTDRISQLYNIDVAVCRK